MPGIPPTAKEAAVKRAENHKTLINGTPVDRSAWQSVVQIFMGNASCTGTIVGPQALITAAHCGETGSVAKFQTYDGKSYTAKLTRNPAYPVHGENPTGAQDKDNDLGFINMPVSVKPTSIRTDRFERIGLPVTMIGYGCTQPDGTGGNDGILRMGKSVVAGAQGFDLILKTPNGAALCYGDSGGPVFAANDAGNLVQIAVNSKGNIQDTSYVTRTTIPDMSDFLTSWSQSTGAGICGVTLDCSAGGGSVTPPPITPPPSPKSSTFEDDKVKVQIQYK